MRSRELLCRAAAIFDGVFCPLSKETLSKMIRDHLSECAPQPEANSSEPPKSSFSDTEGVLQLLIAGGFVAAEKVEKAREIVGAWVQPEAKAGADDVLLSAILAAEQETGVCPRCRGRGYVADADIDDDGRSIGTMDPCPDCGDQAQPKPAEGVSAEQERDMLANAIRDAAVRAGICRDDVSLTGPHLLMLCDDLATAATAGGDPADHACRAHACRRVRVEMRAEIDGLRKLVAGSGEAVGEVYALPTQERRVQLAKHARDLPVGTKVYAGALPADAEALTDARDIIYAVAIKVTGDQQTSHDIANTAAVEVARRLSAREG